MIARRLFILIFGCWLSACDSAPYPIVNSDYWVQTMTGTATGIYWIDNDRVIFAGAALRQIEENKKRGELFQAAINVWDTKQRKVTQIAKRGNGLCYYKGYLRYSYGTNEGGVHVSILGEGHLDALTERQPAKRTGDDALYIIRNEFTCKDFDLRQLPGHGDDIRRTPLRDGHGHLERGKWALRSPNMHLRLFPPGNTQGIELPLQQWQTIDKPIQYLEFANAYLIYSSAPRPKEATTYPLHLLSPDGKVRKVEVPDMEGMNGSTLFYPVRDGVIAGLGGDPRYRSIYFFPRNGEKAKRLIGGDITPAVASPDGCKLAFTHTIWSSIGKPGVPTLKTINFCK